MCTRVIIQPQLKTGKRLYSSFSAVPNICYLSLNVSRRARAFNIEAHSQIENYTGSTLRYNIGQYKVLAISHHTKCALKICSFKPDRQQQQQIHMANLSLYRLFRIQRCPLAHPPMTPSRQSWIGICLKYVEDFLTERVEIEIYRRRIYLLDLPAG